ncbi:dual specificity protein phosphatase family protein [Acinetobacter sp. WU_MDCI_Abxe161]|uniref:dual specificity protein phosphatase family protein n=1 Tax=Acinetobacter sp. WU_MDCI_Abxe161 TaxID=2850074 RepID=UPI0021CD4DFD|nr:dual specificity protein phosphatase family protein [Acinetobacter sp. WU_MDCI_Abxe161]MCU4503955.1 dual specificity protein phosphatase family protein [Acinetobacter sp. WU_MDCI_Abxe161]
MKKLSLLTLVICINLQGCMQHESIAHEHRPQDWGSLVSQTHNFYQISNDVFRSEQPNAAMISELKKNQIETIINLRAKDADTLVFKNENFNLVHIPINTWAINRQDLLEVMQQIKRAKQNNQRVLLHCYHGSDRTGASVAMYRIIFENWAIDDAVKEMKHGGYGYHIIWKNIDRLFTPENVRWIQQQLSNSSS